jgi:hypothetical protein
VTSPHSPAHPLLSLLNPWARARHAEARAAALSEALKERDREHALRLDSMAMAHETALSLQQSIAAAAESKFTFCADQLQQVRAESRELRDQLAEAHRKLMAIGSPAALRALSREPRPPAPETAPPAILAISPAALRTATPIRPSGPLTYINGQPPTPEDIDNLFAAPTEGA